MHACVCACVCTHVLYACVPACVCMFICVCERTHGALRTTVRSQSSSPSEVSGDQAQVLGFVLQHLSPRVISVSPLPISLTPAASRTEGPASVHSQRSSRGEMFGAPGHGQQNEERDPGDNPRMPCGSTVRRKCPPSPVGDALEAPPAGAQPALTAALPG